MLLLDRVELSLAQASTEVFARAARPLGLGPADRCLPAAEVEPIIEAQYQACLEYIYGHPVWQRFREGGAQQALFAYLIESRHYLAAAPFRMASGVTDALRPSDLIRLQAHHVVEEANHDMYFENGLAALGAPRDLLRQARPSPVTVEWVHLMRTVAAYSPLAAGICSGLLEYTASDSMAVTGWHQMLVAEGLLSDEAVRAIFEHVETDLGLGHGSNWRKALHAAKVVPAEELADWLNSVTLVAEMIVRWLDTFETGLSGDVVAMLPDLTLPADATDRVYGGEVDGLPVWPAEVYQSFAHGPRSNATAVRQSLALAYAFAGKAGDRAAGTTPAVAARDFANRAGIGWIGDGSAVDLEKLVESWLTAIDGHEMWRELTERPTYPLVYGWMAENYHYVSGIWQHAAAAISACPDSLIRNELVEHLIEEFNHGKMFRRGIDAAQAGRYAGLPVASARPLPTTVAFVGTLRELGQRNWKAYVLALAYLQLSLSAGDNGVHERHEQFYQAMARGLPDCERLVSAMRQHDDEDTRLGHGEDTRKLLRLLAERHTIDAETVTAAALIPQLTWSFLDGVWCHYRHGDAAVLQRVGWHVTA
ncbi:hypothetical protein [Micromonospora carbonacea]|uniref:hypothetical protein n=1 Tax=Micromonospora carbonacea TaxID=47853 RepID=UPI003711EA9B